MNGALAWLTGGRTIEVPCTVDIEQTFDSLHAHASPEGVDVGPGDRVVVHGRADRRALWPSHQLHLPAPRSTAPAGSSGSGPRPRPSWN